jgi:hypothetical protein
MKAPSIAYVDLNAETPCEFMCGTKTEHRCFQIVQIFPREAMNNIMCDHLSCE